MIGMEIREDERESSTWVDECWSVKEDVREKQGLLKQDEHFFRRTYIRSKSYVMVDMSEMVVGFGMVTDDSYLALLAVKPSYQGYGIGKKIMREVIEENGGVYCHTRSSNKKAKSFYQSLGFNQVDSVQEYYNDGEDAVVLEHEGYSSSSSSSSSSSP